MPLASRVAAVDACRVDRGFLFDTKFKEGVARITLGDLVNRKQDYVEAENAGS